MKLITFLAAVALIFACNTRNPNTPQPADPTLPRGANELADSVDSLSTDTINFNKTKRDQTNFENRP